MVMEKDERDQEKANSLLRLLENKIAAQGPQEKKNSASLKELYTSPEDYFRVGRVV